MSQLTGFGCRHFSLAIYIANRPNTADYNVMTDYRPIQTGEIELINQACGNGWRKVFNVYAKLIHALGQPYLAHESPQNTWQHYRDHGLLQQGSHTALLFSAPIFPLSHDAIHIIMGKTYASKLLADANLLEQLIWLDPHFALLPAQQLIICPYFDYRQLSNAKLARLVALIKAQSKGETL